MACQSTRWPLNGLATDKDILSDVQIGEEARLLVHGGAFVRNGVGR